ncbi:MULTISPECIES: helix-turn-helix domain-containing protein [unclassified Microbacterium]|uniref:helix-turn-helix transcriptional regulator n=1 Tax=unclassified Microbacterium TaxID=2609290 RepID=UPI0010F6EE97|nr:MULTISPECIES: helix-turn-helix domain-containing protein [unclassified Microbacterium]
MDRTAFGELPELATRRQVAEFTQTSVPTLARWAGEGKGPKSVRLGGGSAVRYRREDVLAWIEAS